MPLAFNRTLNELPDGHENFDFIEHLIGISKHCQIAKLALSMIGPWSRQYEYPPIFIFSLSLSTSLSLLLLHSLKAYITFNLIAAYVQALKWP